MAVAVEGLDGDTEGRAVDVLVDLALRIDSPDHDGLITGGRDDEGRVLNGGGEGGDPTVVTCKVTTKRELDRHV